MTALLVAEYNRINGITHGPRGRRGWVKHSAIGPWALAEGKWVVNAVQPATNSPANDAQSVRQGEFSQEPRMQYIRRC